MVNQKMKTTKILLAPLVLMLLLSFASAIVIDTVWQDDSKDITIEKGDTVTFDVYTSSMFPPMTLNITLYDPDNIVIDTFGGEITEIENIYSGAFSIDSSAYALGDYELIVLTNDGVETQNETILLTVGDSVVPTITLTGASPINILVGDTYTELGATATDNVDGDITGSIVIDSSTVNTAVGGTYQVTYNVQDASGNAAIQITRTVVVSVLPVDLIDPVLTIVTPTNGTEYNSDTMVFEVTVDEPATVELSIDGADFTMSDQGNNTFTYTLTGMADGAHTVIFTATDLGGNVVVSNTIDFTIAQTVVVDDDGNSSSTGTFGSIETPSEYDDNLYLSQFNTPIQLNEEALGPTDNRSFIRRVIDRIIGFFKKLFGLN